VRLPPEKLNGTFTLGGLTLTVALGLVTLRLILGLASIENLLGLALLRRRLTKDFFTSLLFTVDTVLHDGNTDAVLVILDSFLAFLRHTLTLPLGLFLLGSGFLFEAIHVHGVESSRERGGLEGERNSGFSELAFAFLRQSR